MNDSDEKITRIFLIRDTDITALMQITLDWVSPPILKKRKIPTVGLNGYWHDTLWEEGEFKLIIDDYVEKKDFEFQKLIDGLNKINIPVVSYPNDLLQHYLIAGFYPIIENQNVPDEYKEHEVYELSDISDHLLATNRIINNSKTNIATSKGRDLITMAIKTFKSRLVTNIHSYYEIPISTRLSNSEAGLQYLHDLQIKNILSERSQYNPDGIRYE